MKLHDWQKMTTKIDKWLSNCTLSKGNLQLYETAKKYCSEISNSPDEYEMAIKYLTQRIKI